MLHSLRSNDRRFKCLEFTSGLNIITSARASPTATTARDGDRYRTRNGAGKTSFVHLIHFMLGGDPDGPLKSESLKDSLFSLDFDLGGARITASRSVSTKKEIQITGDLPRLQMGDEGVARLTVTPWTRLLGTRWFGLDSEQTAGATSFRSLFPYFARWDEAGGFLDATRYLKVQRQAIVDTNLAFLFGFDYELVRRLYRVKDAREKLAKARNALRDLEKDRPAGSRKSDVEALIRAELSAAGMARDKLKAEVEAFRVLPTFRELEAELAIINQTDRTFSDADVMDRELLEAHDQALLEEQTPDQPDLDRLFAEAKIVFPDLIRRRYEEVQAFHESLVANRRTYLEAEKNAATRRIADRLVQRQRLEVRRSSIMRELSGGMPGDDLLKLRQELSDREAKIRGLEGKLSEARQIEERDETLKIEFDEAARALRGDWRERALIANDISKIFAEISAELYGTAGTLEISAGENVDSALLRTSLV